MHYLTFWHAQAWRPITASGLLVLSLIALPAISFAQEQEEQEVSAEAAKESVVDLNAELGLPADYDPVVPNNFINSIGYGFKKFGRGLQRAAYSAFASDKKEAELIKRQADKSLVEAVKLQSLEPDNKKVVDILGDYQSKITGVADKIEKVKSKDSDFAKQFAEEIVQDNLFMAPKVLSQIEESLIANRPELIPDFMRTKDEALAAAADAVVKASDNSSQAAETFKLMALKNFKTPFSGLNTADVFAQAQNQLPQDQHGVFDEAIKASLDNVEENLKTLPATEELKAQAFQRYVEQLPGQGLSRMKMIEQLRSRAELPEAMIEKMSEMKAKMAEHMSRRIEAVPDEKVRKAMTDAMFQFKEGKLEDLKMMNEMKDIIPSEEIRAHMKQKHEEGVGKFLSKFGDDSNARAVTEEFQDLSRKMESGEVLPDANFFKTLNELKGRLSPDQQRFVDQMEQTGKEEMAERMKSDPNFSQRFSSFNPGDIEYFDGFKEEFRNEIPNFEAKFREMEQRQANNFRQLLDVQVDPEKVRELENHFNQEIPPEIRQKFESNYQLDFEGEFKKHAEQAREKEEFFRQKFGEEFPGQGSFGFPGRGPGQFGKPELLGPPTEACGDGRVKTDFGCEIKFEAPKFDQEKYCAQKGGSWTGVFCKLPSFKPPQDEGDMPDEAYKRPPEEGGDLPVPQRQEFNPERYCAQKGGTWTGASCQQENSDPSRSNQELNQERPVESFRPPTQEFKPPFNPDQPARENFQQPPTNGEFKPPVEQVQGAFIERPVSLVDLLNLFINDLVKGGEKL